MSGLLGAYIRRKKAEGALLFGGAMEIMNKSKNKREQASLGQLAMMGFGIKGGK